MKYLLILTLALSFAAGCEKEPEPDPCQDYAYILSRVPGTQDVAACRQNFDDVGMDMKIEASGTMLNRTTMVYCTCNNTPSPKAKAAAAAAATK